MSRAKRSREDREATASGIATALQTAFAPKEQAAEAQMDLLIERLARLGSGLASTPARAG